MENSDLAEFVRQEGFILMNQLRERADELPSDDTSLIYVPQTIIDQSDKSKVKKGLTIKGIKLETVSELQLVLFSTNEQAIGQLEKTAKNPGWREADEDEVETLGLKRERVYTNEFFFVGFSDAEQFDKKFYVAKIIYINKDDQGEPLTNHKYLDIMQMIKDWIASCFYVPEISPTQKLEGLDGYELVKEEDVMVGENHQGKFSVNPIESGGIEVRLEVEIRRKLGQGLVDAHWAALGLQDYSVAVEYYGKDNCKLLITRAFASKPAEGYKMDVLDYARKLVERIDL